MVAKLFSRWLGCLHDRQHKSKDIAMGLVAGLVPVLIRFCNPNDATFGITKSA
jgi:hypothetical protein